MIHSSNFLGLGIGMYLRFVERRADEALSDTPVVLIVGASDLQEIPNGRRLLPSKGFLKAG
jgi:hypothetical protein